MDREDIIRMAREAGFNLEHGFLLRVTGIDEDLERFAALVAAHEREKCANIAKSYEPTCDTCPSGVANAIRARKEK